MNYLIIIKKKSWFDINVLKELLIKQNITFPNNLSFINYYLFWKKLNKEIGLEFPLKLKLI